MTWRFILFFLAVTSSALAKESIMQLLKSAKMVCDAEAVLPPENGNCYYTVSPFHPVTEENGRVLARLESATPSRTMVLEGPRLDLIFKLRNGKFVLVESSGSYFGVFRCTKAKTRFKVSVVGSDPLIGYFRGVGKE